MSSNIIEYKQIIEKNVLYQIQEPEDQKTKYCPLNVDNIIYPNLTSLTLHLNYLLPENILHSFYNKLRFPNLIQFKIKCTTLTSSELIKYKINDWSGVLDCILEISKLKVLSIDIPNDLTAETSYEIPIDRMDHQTKKIKVSPDFIDRMVCLLLLLKRKKKSGSCYTEEELRTLLCDSKTSLRNSILLLEDNNNLQTGLTDYETQRRRLWRSYSRLSINYAFRNLISLEELYLNIEMNKGSIIDYSNSKIDKVFSFYSSMEQLQNLKVLSLNLTRNHVSNLQFLNKLVSLQQLTLIIEPKENTTNYKDLTFSQGFNPSIQLLQFFAPPKLGLLNLLHHTPNVTTLVLRLDLMEETPLTMLDLEELLYEATELTILTLLGCNTVNTYLFDSLLLKDSHPSIQLVSNIEHSNETSQSFTILKNIRDIYTVKSKRVLNPSFALFDRLSDTLVINLLLSQYWDLKDIGNYFSQLSKQFRITLHNPLLWRCSNQWASKFTWNDTQFLKLPTFFYNIPCIKLNICDDQTGNEIINHLFKNHLSLEHLTICYIPKYNSCWKEMTINPLLIQNLKYLKSVILNVNLSLNHFPTLLSILHHSRTIESLKFEGFQFQEADLNEHLKSITEIVSLKELTIDLDGVICDNIVHLSLSTASGLRNLINLCKLTVASECSEYSKEFYHALTACPNLTELNVAEGFEFFEFEKFAPLSNLGKQLVKLYVSLDPYSPKVLDKKWTRESKEFPLFPNLLEFGLTCCYGDLKNGSLDILMMCPQLIHFHWKCDESKWTSEDKESILNSLVSLNRFLKLDNHKVSPKITFVKDCAAISKSTDGSYLDLNKPDNAQELQLQYNLDQFIYFIQSLEITFHLMVPRAD